MKSQKKKKKSCREPLPTQRSCGAPVADFGTWTFSDRHVAPAVLQSSRAVGRHNDSLFLLASVGKIGRGDVGKRKTTVMNRRKGTNWQGGGENRESKWKMSFEKLVRNRDAGGGGRWGGSISLGRACSPREPAEVRWSIAAPWLVERDAALSPPPLKKEVQQERQSQTAQDSAAEASLSWSSP